MWSFVGKKKNKQWVWLALDTGTKEIVGVYVGARSRQGAEGLWQSLPALYRQCAVCYTDFWAAYEEIFPKSRHQALGKKSGKTNLTHAFQLYFTATGFTSSQKNPIFLQKARKPHWSYLVLYSPLQRTLAYLGVLSMLYPYLFRTTNN